MFFGVVGGALPHAAATPGQQQTSSTTATLTVHAHVVRNCTVTAMPLDFGDYDPLVANKTQPRDATALLGTNCSRGVAPRVALDNGSNAQGNTRRMAQGTDFLAYELYSDAARTARWGTGSQAVVYPAPITGTHTSGSLYSGAAKPLYGRIPAGQNAPPGDYNDTVTVTLSF